MEFRNLVLDGFQEEAITTLADGGSVLVCAPTGTGKTIIADWIVHHAMETDRRIVYTAPIKALSNQKFRDYCRLHGEEKVGLVTGDLVIRRDAPLRVMTTEILRNMLLSGEDLSDLIAVVIDEIHFLDDKDRGTVWEEVLIYLPSHVQIVGLSATLSNVKEFSDWLSSVRKTPVKVVEEHKRAVPLHVGFANTATGLVNQEDFEKQWKQHQSRAAKEARPKFKGYGKKKGSHRKQRRQRYIRKTRDNHVVNMLVEAELLPALYFAFSRRDIEMYARNLTQHGRVDLLNQREQMALSQALDAAARDLGPILRRELRGMYEQGIAFHHAGLHVQLKTLVETLYEQRLIKVLYCTSTFALGINLPAKTVVFDGLKKFDGQQVSPLKVRQFMQKAGRAGRRGLDSVGYVFVRMDFEEYAEWRPLIAQYQRGRSEPAHSRFSLSWNSVASLLHQYEPDRVKDLVERSFLNWHYSKEAERQRNRATAMEDTIDHEKKQRPAQRKQAKEAHRLRRRADQVGGKCWKAFRKKVQYLKHIGYLGKDNEFNAGANILLHLQISEILITELVLAGIFEDIDPAHLFGVLCGLVADFPRKAKPIYNLTRVERRISYAIQTIRESDIVVEAEELAQIEYNWSPLYLPLGRAWAEGVELQVILNRLEFDTDIASDIISAFRRAKDLAGQLRSVFSDHEELEQRLKTMVKTVSRDEVEVVG